MDGIGASATHSSTFSFYYLGFQLMSDREGDSDEGDTDMSMCSKCCIAESHKKHLHQNRDVLYIACATLGCKKWIGPACFDLKTEVDHDYWLCLTCNDGRWTKDVEI